MLIYEPTLYKLEGNFYSDKNYVNFMLSGLIGFWKEKKIHISYSQKVFRLFVGRKSVPQKIFFYVFYS